MAVDQDDLAGLSPEEVAALSDDDTNASDEADLLKTIADDDNSTDSTDADENSSDTSDEDNAEDQQEEANETSDFMPTQAVYAVEDFDNKMAELKTAKSALREQLNNGDIDLDQYEAKKDEISDQETSLRIKQATAENAAKQNAHIDSERWKWEQEQFFSAKTNAIYTDKIVMAALNAAVIDLANDPKNANQKGMFFLNEADKLVRERFNMGQPKQEKQVTQNRKPDLSKIPKTLSNLPSADTEQSNEGEFSHLDKLSGMDLERAVAKLNPDQVERYLRG